MSIGVKQTVYKYLKCCFIDCEPNYSYLFHTVVWFLPSLFCCILRFLDGMCSLRDLRLLILKRRINNASMSVLIL